jgi:Tol biopolymer transport system component
MPTRPTPAAARRAMLALLLTCLAAALVPAVASAYEKIVFERGGSIYSADSTGAGQVLLTSSSDTTHYPLNQAALSPSGSQVAYHDDCAPALQCIQPNTDADIWLTSISGGRGRDVLPSNFNSAQQGHPRFSPDGQKLIFERIGSGGDWDIFTARSDGAYQQALVTGSATQLRPTYSADGTKITYVSSPTGGAGTQVVYVADATGANPRSLAVVGWEPRFSPDGTKIAYATPTSPSSIWVIGTNGSGAKQLTRGSKTSSDSNPDWSPDGTKIAFTRTVSGVPSIHTITAAGASDTTLISNASGGSFRQPSTNAFRDADTAASYRPTLYFDGPGSVSSKDVEGEQWRPLNAEELFKEPDPNSPGYSYNTIIDPLTSQNLTVTSWTALRQYPSSGSWINFGTNPQTSSDASAYKSPYNGCLAGLRDCDSNFSGDPQSDGKTAIYYHVVPATDGYRYIDYWFLYRYNDWPNETFGVDPTADHEADWEGVTIAPSNTVPGTFDFASFSQHGHWYTYLRDALSCDGGSAGSCGTSTSKRGQRLSVYPAFGTHANYQGSCDGTYSPCGSSSAALGFDTAHNGRAPWLANNDPSALIAFPNPIGWGTPSTAVWTDWPGSWGATSQPTDHGPVQSPAGPYGGNGDHYRSPWTAQGASHGSHDVRCESFFGSSVSAAACSPSQLRLSVQARRLGRRGTLSVSVPGRRTTAASAPGVAQALSKPLRAGDRVLVRGSGAADTALYLRARDGAYTVEARVTGLGLALAGGAGKATVRVVRRAGRLAFEVRGAGGATAGRALRVRVQRKRLSGAYLRYERRLRHARRGH